MSVNKSSIRVVSEASTRALGLVVVFFLSRALGPEEFGIYSVCFVAATLVAFVSDAGSGLYLIGNLGGKKDAINKAFHVLVPYRAMVGLVLGLATWGFLYIAGYNAQWLWFYGILLFWVLCNSWTDSIGFAFLAVGEVVKDAAIKFAGKSLVNIALICLAVYGYSSGILLSSAAGIAFLGVLFALFLYFKNFPAHSFFGTKEDYTNIKDKCTPLIFGGLVALLLSRNDLLILQWTGNDAQALGCYGAVIRLQDMVLLSVVFLMEALLPSLSCDFQEDIGKFKKRWTKIIAPYCALGVVALIFFEINPIFWMTLLFGDKFSAGGELLAVLALRFPFTFGRLTMLYAFITMEDQKTSSFLTFLTLLASIPINFFAAHFYGINGLVWSVVLLEASAFIFISYFFVRRLRFHALTKKEAL